MATITSAFALTQMEDITDKLIEFRGVAKDEEIDYNGTNYTAGDLMGELRKDYDWWEAQYNKALVLENETSYSYPSYKQVKGWEIL